MPDFSCRPCGGRRNVRPHREGMCLMDTMKSLERKTLQGAAWVLVQRLAMIAGAALFVLVVPRLMGPSLYGRFALLTSVCAWCVMLSELGLAQVFSRYLPRELHDNVSDGVARFFSTAMIFRTAAATAVAAVCFLVTHAVLPDLGLAPLLLIAAATWMEAANDTLFCLFLGLHQAARWAMGDAGRCWLTVLLVPAGFAFGGLVGAVAGLLAVEALLLAVGTAWARPRLQRSGPRFAWRHFRPYMRFGLVFFIGALLGSTSRNIGAVLVQGMSHDYAEVGYFGLAYGMYQAAAGAYLQLVQSFTPFLSTLVHQERREDLALWSERLLKAATVIAVPAVFGALLLGKLVVEIVSGHDYVPAARCLWPMALCLLALIPGRLAGALAVAVERPGLTLRASCVRLAVLVPLGLVLTRWGGSFGMCLALLASSTAYALWLMVSLRPVVSVPCRQWGVALAAGALFVPLAFLRTGVPGNVLLFVLASAGYAALVWRLGVVKFAEVRSLFQPPTAGEEHA